MKKLIYQEFGVRSEIIKYHEIGEKLKGMKEGKPFVKEKGLFINVGANLCEVDLIKFFDETNKAIDRSEVFLDTEVRVAGVLVNTRGDLLLLKVSKEKEYFCFPGGHRREFESIERCLIREMQEEVGINIQNMKFEYLLSIHVKGFGPEEFFLIDLKDEVIEFCDEDPNDQTSKLVLMKLKNIYKFDNVFPSVVVEAMMKSLNLHF
ncbi:NUDIX hydrolase [Candidatus Dojkabacteria bacterium]|nr:NUDIX hydrolase [Candidatus Dojkabacteria bacterium]